MNIGMIRSIYRYMKKENFLEILKGSTPQEIQEFIQANGKQKMVNVFAPIPKEEFNIDTNTNIGEDNNE